MRRGPHRLSDGITGVRQRNGDGLPAASLGDVGRSPVRVQPRVPDEPVAVHCWCERKVMSVHRSQVSLGRTSSCGVARCVPPAGYAEAERKCCDCGDWYTPRTASSRRCAPCNAVKHVG